MNARDFFNKLSSAIRERNRTAVLLRELSGVERRGVESDPGIDSERRASLQRRYERGLDMERRGESLLASIPNREAAYVLRRKYLHSWTMRHIAHDLGVSLRKVYYLQCHAFRWMDENAPLDEAWMREP